MSSCTVTQSCEDFEFEDWSIDFNAFATSIHEPMVKYYKDGTGYPGYDGVEDYEWTFNKVVDAECNELELGKDGYPVNWDEETKKRCEAALIDYLDNHDWDYPEDPGKGWDEPPED